MYNINKFIEYNKKYILEHSPNIDIANDICVELLKISADTRDDFCIKAENIFIKYKIPLDHVFIDNASEIEDADLYAKWMHESYS